MFGIPTDIKNQSLYLLHDMVENQILNLEHAKEECKVTEQDKISILEARISFLKSETQKFKEEVDSQLKHEFQFSIEELYSMYGQYDDRFLSIEFHKFSETAIKYGRNLRGCIYYPKYERDELEALTTSDSVTRTMGLVKLELLSDDIELSDELKKDLKENGFNSGDIYQILTVNLPVIKSYGKSGKKDIPNTIDVKFDPSAMDPYLLNRNLFIDRLQRGGILTEFEWHDLAGYTCYYEPKGIESISERIFNHEGNKYDEVRLAELIVKYHHTDIEAKDIIEFSELLKKKRLNRERILKQEISRSTTKKLEEIESEYPVIHKELIESTIAFKSESLVFFNSFKPIFWDYERFVHIYLRHCSELGIEGKFEGKTKFQYAPKDIQRVLKIVIKKLLPEITEAITQGKDYRANGAKVLYYNGNHYSIHISNEGRVLAFHPIENPD